MGTQQKSHSFEKFLQVKGKRRAGISCNLSKLFWQPTSPAAYWPVQDLMSKRESGLYLICSPCPNSANPSRWAQLPGTRVLP